ncbi:SusC/RagA family TonB-linked outer membrane protein [Marinifilum caeruleilacunae]|uniref:SusC/RagA family TonB-linked outer membrane protein n=1 Tax=Marinifilum caeruleilacunae TaxID=2499076 RepID=A0ABX1WRH2_9BACT|nr:SusC/RagA family TonB-linked outer membrane protein [Marinifilum caeruleilacunae]NOU58668.1 SusC/RagA family TonB-linked outer membrane protein [Marinifilum caeruleilacunae]
MVRIYLIALLVLLQFQLFAQGLTVAGTVTDAGDKLGIPGVTVLEKGTSNGVTTDFDGKFTLKVSKANAELMFSFIGYETQFIPVKGQKVINVQLKSADQKLNEVVVLGYGSVKSREAVVGSVEQVKSDELLKHSNAQSVDQMLEGQVAGVYLESDDGNPNSPVKVRIRGNNSLPDLGSNITASSEPLYILDGVPLVDALNPNVDQKSGAAADDQIVINPLALINPEDIESVSILKDASAAAIYGANAANGVVIITTKKGVKGKTRVNISHKTLLSTPINKIEYLNTDQYVELATEYYRNSGYSEESIPEEVGRTDVYTNWRDLTLQNSVAHQTNLNISGGSDKTTYRLSFGYKDNETTTKGNDSESIISRLSLDTELAKGVRLSYSGGISSFKSEKYAAFATYAYKPNIPVYDEEGKYTQMETYANPLADLAQNTNESEKFYSNNSLNLKVKISKNFSSSSMFGLDYTNTKQYSFYSKENGRGRKKNGVIKEKRTENNNWVTYTQLEYNGSVKKHSFGATAGIQLKHDERNQTSVSEENLVSEKIRIPGNGDDEDSSVSSSESESAMRSYYGRFNYDFGKKYFLSMNFRSDASSYFGGDQKVENFASIGGSWIISKENFWIENDIINFVKLKSSFGKLGNAKVGSYSARGLYSYSTSSSYNGKLIAQPYAAPNEDLGWQQSYKFNAGLIVKFLRKFTLETEYYNNKTKDGILSLNVVPETGWNIISVNTADLTNYGLEFTLKASNIMLGKVQWNSNFNIGFNKSRLDKLALYSERFVSGTAGLIVGESTSLIMGNVYAGVDANTGDPQWKMKDGSITKDPSDLSGVDNKQIIGKSNPDFTGGFSNNFNYKGFNLSFMIAFEYGADKMMPYPARDMENIKTLNIYNKSVNLLDRWQKPGDRTDIPRLDKDIKYNAYSTRFLFDQSNVSVRSIALHYNLPKSLCSSMRLANASLGVNVSNVYTWYKEGGKSGRNGLAEYRYPFPQSRTVAFQLKLGI